MTFQEEKQTQPLTQDRTFTWEAAVFSFSSRSELFSHRCCAENHISILRMTSMASTQLLHLFLQHPQAKEPRNANLLKKIQEQWAPAWSSFLEVFSHRKNGEVFLSCLHVLSPHTDSPRLCYSVEEGGYTALPVSSHVEQPPMPPQTEKDCRLEATLTHVPHSPCA